MPLWQERVRSLPAVSEWAVEPLERQIVAEQPLDSQAQPARKFRYWLLPENFLTTLNLYEYDPRSHYECFLIFLAKRFNTAYDLLLITGDWSGGETSKVVDVC